jgi:Zn-dependent protease
MKWSWKIGTFAGIKVYVHATFIFLIAWFMLIEWGQSHSWYAVAGAVLFILALFTCIVAHEFGHALVARRFGVQTRDITLLPIGGVSSLERIPDNPAQEFWVAIAGPAVSIGIAFLLLPLVVVSGTNARLSPTGPWGNVPFVEQLMLANVVLAIFNLLPAFPMDGGRIFRSLLAKRMDYARATRIAANVGQLVAVGFAMGGLFANPFLLLIALFVWVGADQEAAFAKLKSVLSGIPVSSATVTDFNTISPSKTLQTPIELMLHGSQQDFPVMDNGRLVGMLTRKELLSALSQKGPDTLVSDVMRKDYPTVSSSEMLEAVSQKLLAADCQVLLVVDGGELRGLLTVENLAEFVMFQSAMHPRKTRGGPASRKSDFDNGGGSPKAAA